MLFYIYRYVKQFYDVFMPGLKTILATAKSDEESEFRLTAMECIGCIGISVGPEKFANDAQELMDALLDEKSKTVFMHSSLSLSALCCVSQYTTCFELVFFFSNCCFFEFWKQIAAPPYFKM